MSAAPHMEGVVDWPVNIGSETTVPIHWVMRGSPESPDGLLAWVGGFGVRKENLAPAVGELARHLPGWQIVGVEMPVGDVVSKATDVKGGLSYLVNDGVHKVVGQVGDSRVPFLGGDSRGGKVVLEAGDHGPNRGIVALFPMGLNNEVLGDGPLQQGFEIGMRLVRTANDHGGPRTFFRDPANRGVVIGGIREIVAIALRGRLVDALDYGFGGSGTESLARKLVAYRDRAEADSQFDISLLLAENDSCFPPEESIAMLRRIGCEGLARVIKGCHTCVGGQAAVSQLAEVGQWLNAAHAKQTNAANGQHE